MYQRQVYKKGINLQTLENKDGNEKEDISEKKAFEKYFTDKDLFDLFKFKDDSEGCDTLELIMKKDKFQYEKSPTNDAHIKYLQSQQDIVKGLTLNTNLYTEKEEVE